MRTTILLITILITNSLAMAEPTAKDKKMDKLPPFINPLKIAKFVDDGNGKISEVNGDVCYNKSAHTKLTIYLKNVKPASDLRTLTAFNEGYIDGYESGTKRTLELKRQSENSTLSDIVQSKILWFAIGASSSFFIVELFK